MTSAETADIEEQRPSTAVSDDDKGQAKKHVRSYEMFRGFFKNFLKIIALSSFLILVIWGGVSAAQATGSARYWNNDDLASNGKSMEQAFNAWTRGQTVILEHKTDKRFISLSPSASSGDFWIIQEDLRGSPGYDRLVQYEYLSRGNGIILRATCHVDPDGTSGEKRDKGKCIIDETN